MFFVKGKLQAQSVIGIITKEAYHDDMLCFWVFVGLPSQSFGVKSPSRLVVTIQIIF
jgi:hypothetical protein